MSENMNSLSLAIALAFGIAVFWASTVSASVMKQQFGGTSAGTPIVGSDQHLPPLTVTSPYIVDSAIGANIVKLRDSGGYTSDINGTIARARKYLNVWLTRNCGKNANAKKVRSCKAMLVADVDDTLVSWYQYYSDPTVNWKADADAEDVVMKACGTPAITPSVKLLNYARSRGVEVVLITGRKDVQRTYTAECVKKIGVKSYKSLILRDKAEYETTAALFKAQQRKALEREGWKIAVSLGDQVSDMSGGYADAGFLLPNPMYFIP